MYGSIKLVCVCTTESYMGGLHAVDYAYWFPLCITRCRYCANVGKGSLSYTRKYE